MRSTDFDAFSALLDDAWSLKGQALTGGAKAMFFRALAAYPIDIVRGALSAHFADAKRGQFLPMPADVIAQIERAIADDDRPGAEEAWAVAMRSTDEGDTIVWTTETAEAFGVCRPILEARDKVGARMAFREAYERLVDDARAARRPVAWTASLGNDPERRARVITQAVEAKRLPSPGALVVDETRLALGYGPAHATDIADLPAPRAAVALLEHSTESGIPDFAREALLSLRKWLTTPSEERSAAEIERERTLAAKRETAAKFAAYEAARAAAEAQPAALDESIPSRAQAQGVTE
jgi:hypothetical protein